MAKKKTIVKKATKNKRIKKQQKLDPDQFLLLNRQVFIYDTITNETILKATKEIMTLATLSSKPIILWINSPGGSVSAGFALIDTIEKLNIPVITYVTGQACSMGGLLMLAGKQRLMTKNAIWMAHDMAGGIIDYATKAIDRAEYWKVLQKQIFDYLSKKTKLSKEEINKAQHGELWLTADECLKKGICDMVVK